MISKESAIQILDKFLYSEYSVDPIYRLNLKAHRIYISENDYSWILVTSDEKDIYKREAEIGGIGGGTYYIDKSDGEIYEIGSSPSVNWEKDFIKYKTNKVTDVDWIPKRINYIECKYGIHFKVEFQQVRVRCKIDEKEEAIRAFFLRGDFESESNLNSMLLNKPFEAEEGELIVGVNGKLSTEKICTIEKQFQGGLFASNSILWDLKKWLRVNNQKGSDNYWIEIEENNFEKDFNDWNLKYKMEII